LSYTAIGIRSHGFHRAPAAGTVRKITRGIRAAKILATTKELPVALRVLLVVGAIQTPLPLDEVALLIALPWLWFGHRNVLAAAIVKARQA
jgi:hypothetical protein